MANYSKRFGRQLLVMAAVLLGTTLFLMTLTPPQEAQGQENNKNEPALSQQEEQEDKKQTKKQTAQSEEKTAQNGPQQETDEPDESNNDQNERVLDEDPQGNEYVAGELLVTYKKGAFEKAKDEAPKKINGKVETDFPEIEVQLVSVPEVKDEQDQGAREQALEKKKDDLEQDPDVEAVDYNHILEGAYVPNDPYYSYQWGYPKINAPAAWDKTRGSSNIRVAVLDSGIDYNHADLKGKVVAQRNFVTNPDTTVAQDDHGHGTHVAGTVAASTNNGLGVTGTCPNCSLMIAKVLDRNNQGSSSDLIAGINWASSNGAYVINMSLGGYLTADGQPPVALETAINNAWTNEGSVLVGVAGNGGTNGTKHYPGAYPNVIAVAATDSNDARANFDDPNTTVIEQSNSGDWVDVAAPGRDVYSTLPSSWAFDPNTGLWKSTPRYGYMSGTSMAAPHVSGLAGLYFSKYAGLYNREVRTAIERTAVDLGTPGRDPIFGAGRINANAAVSLEVRDHR